MNHHGRALMKWLLVVMTGSLFGVSGQASAQMIEVHTDFDDKSQTVEVYSAPSNEVDKTSAWELERDAPFLSHPELLAIARKNLSFDTTKYRLEEVAGLDWRRSNFGWLVIVHFRLRLHPNNGLVKDGDRLVAVRLLPNGVPLKRSVRPMTQDEKGLPAGPPPDPFSK